MTRQWPFPRFIPHFLLMFVVFAVQVFASPRLSNPCNRIRSDFDAQIKALKQRQKLELQSCRSGGSDQCSSLKALQKEELRQLNRERDYQLRGCERIPLTLGIPAANTNECYTARQEYVNNYYDRKPGDNDHYPPPSPGKDGPGKVVSTGSGDSNHPGHRLPRDSGGEAGDPSTYSRRDGSSASTSSGHNSGSGHNASGGSSTSASSGHSSGGGSSYSGGGSSGGGGSSSGSSHSSGGGSSSSGGGYSGGSSSSGGGSYSGGGSSASSSSAPSHDSGAARPK